ncbi:UDP-N-acetylglucosamine--LPS N-acetylglucosamine transferase [Glutamicibacter uratoxydans]|uniref:UDP-N-acetylglucosamine--LPS N-acetylglucosamine transferase n=1 Tax=Glutamicibacter uratoxydans TaxID=43667 RepID=UPI003D6E4BEF
MSAWWKDQQRCWVTFDTPDAISALRGERVHWAYHPTTRNPLNALRNFLLSIKLLRVERPEAIISTGAGVALPFFLTAKLMRIPTAYVEVYDRIDSQTLTGKLCRPLASIFCVQWEEQLKHYPGAVVIGPLL